MSDQPRNATRLIGGIYRTGQVLTTNAMLTTYTAYNRNTNDVVGLHVIEIPPTLQLNAVQYLLLPIEKRRSIQSTHVIHVSNWGIDGNRIYIATDPPRGLTLQHVLDNENIDLQRAVDLTRQIALGLQALHAQGTVALDLRPQLITVDTVGIDDRVQIDDIGLRPLLQNMGYVSNLRPDDIGFLDPRYAPPEYINNGPGGPWSDFYQLGILLFTMLTGRLPFVGRTHAETGILQSSSPPPLMRQLKHEIPDILQQIVEQMLAKDPSRRFGSVDAVLSALDSVHLPPRPTHTQPMQTVLKERETGPRAMGSNQTTEMSREDIALRATIIAEKNPLHDLPASPNIPTTTGVHAYLCYDKQDGEVQRFPIMKQDTIVGRLDPKRGLTPDIDLSSIDPTMTISRQHARIRFEETFFYIEDLKSRNKTRLGELVLTPLKPELLQHGDTIFFGSVRTYFEVPGSHAIPRVGERRKSQGTT